MSSSSQSASVRPAVVLLSGGLDSATALAIARAEGFDPYALSFRYGQRHVHELKCAQEVAQQLGAREHVVVDFDLRKFGGSALTSDIAVPKDRPAGEMSHGIPITYVPARNTIFLSFALAWAETLTRLVGHSVPDAAYEAVRRHFSEEEVTFLSVSIATINAWNRLGAAFRFAPPILKAIRPST